MLVYRATAEIHFKGQIPSSAQEETVLPFWLVRIETLEKKCTIQTNRILIY